MQVASEVEAELSALRAKEEEDLRMMIDKLDVLIADIGSDGGVNFDSLAC